MSAMPDEPVSSGAKLALDGLECIFAPGTGLTATSIALADGEFVALVGPSGCGKSTLMNIVAGLLQPTAGRVLIDGVDVTGRPGLAGYMFQKDLLLPWRTVLGNIVLAASLTSRVSKEDRAEAAEMGRRYGLGEFLDTYPHALSGGMRQRVALMRTLAFHRDVLLLDEPFGALDSQTRVEMQQWLLRVWKDTGRTTLFITHDVDEAIFLADRVMIMSPRPGRIVDTLDVDLPRPRGIDMLTSGPFTDLKRTVMAHLYAPGPTGASEVVR
jgi:ABC-type nitrate/sulfonate/bicarbonate transport system ATPase subunit